MSKTEPDRAVAAFLEDARLDLELAEFALSKKNRLGAFHVQQAAEKLIKAVRAEHELTLGNFVALGERLDSLVDLHRRMTTALIKV